jgi:flagellum-specific ATP synthase
MHVKSHVDAKAVQSPIFSSSAGSIAALGVAPSRNDRLVSIFGKVAAIEMSAVRVVGLSRFARLGDLVRLYDGQSHSLADVITVSKDTITVKLLTNSSQIRLGMAVEYIGEIKVRPHEAWLGRTISAFAEPIDDLGQLPQGRDKIVVQNTAPLATRRQAVHEAIKTGVRAIDIFTPLCFGQRIGVFAGSGVGKSTLLAMVARSPGFDVCLVALVGERGREVKEFISEVLGEALKKSIVVVATGDDSAGQRKMAPLLATRLAEFFRDQGKRVLLIMDSVTRYAMAAREIALAAGEAPVSRGYPPSVFSELPRLLERAGPGISGQGSITGIYSVLVDGDNHNEPISDAVRGILDGHIVLDREIAGSGRFPAVDIMASISRLAHKASTGSNAKLSGEARNLVGRFENTKDLRLLGGYQLGNDKELDAAISITPKIYNFLKQSPEDNPDFNPFSGLAEVIQPQRSSQAATTSRPTS